MLILFGGVDPTQMPAYDAIAVVVVAHFTAAAMSIVVVALYHFPSRSHKRVGGRTGKSYIGDDAHPLAVEKCTYNGPHLMDPNQPQDERDCSHPEPSHGTSMT